MDRKTVTCLIIGLLIGSILKICGASDETMLIAAILAAMFVPAIVNKEEA